MRNFFFILMLLPIFLPGQETFWRNISFSGYNSRNEIGVRVDTSFETPFNEQYLYYRQNNLWRQTPMNNIGGNTWEAVIPYLATDITRLRCELNAEGVCAMQCPELSDNNFPPNFNDLGHLGTYPAGDSQIADADYLDLTGSFLGHTPQKLFAAITNTSGTFPVSESLFGPYNYYAIGFSNPYAVVTDTTAYVMLYGQTIPGFISSGLYKVHISNGSFDPTSLLERIGNIQSTVNNGQLFMACNLADIIAAANGTWDAATEIIGAMPVTLQVSISQQFTLADNGSASLAVFHELSLTPFTNVPPQIQINSIPEAGILHVTYSDANGNFPRTAKAITTSNNEINLTPPPSPDYTANTEFTCFLGENNNLDHVVFSDNNEDYVSAFLVPADEETQPAPSHSLNVYPNPFYADKTKLNIKLAPPVKASQQVEIYNIKGQKIFSAENSNDPFIWQGKDNSNSPCPTGIYFAKIGSKSKKFLLLH